MTSPYDMFKTSEKMETEGIILDYGSFQIKVARAGGSNVAFAKTIERLTKPYKFALENGTMDHKLQMKLLARAFAESVILGWEGIVDESGKPLEYSPDNAEKLLTDLPDLFQDIQSQTMKASLFKQALLDRAAKN